MACSHKHFACHANMARFCQSGNASDPPDMLIAEFTAFCTDCGQPVLWLNQHKPPDGTRPYANCASFDLTKVWIQGEVKPSTITLPEKKLIV